MGWSPPSRSMIARRRAARPAAPLSGSPPSRALIAGRRAASPAAPISASPPLSGPRWRSVALIAASASRSATRPSVRTMPEMPHISVLRGLERPRQHEPDGLGHHLEVQPHGAVGDVLEVVGELLRPRDLAGQAQLREARDPGRDHEALPVGGDLLGETLEEQRPDRARPDDAHVAAQHVPQLRQLVELRGAQDPPDPRLLRLGQPRELLAVERADPRLGLRLQRAELDHREDLATAPDARAAVEHSATPA